MNKTMIISKPGTVEVATPDTLKKRKKIIHKPEKQKTVLDSQ